MLGDLAIRPAAGAQRPNRKEWWRPVPDPDVLVRGVRTEGDILHLSAHAADGSWVLVYSADASTFSVDLSTIGGSSNCALWINPRDGSSTDAGAVGDEAARIFTTPVGWEDAILVIETL